MSYFILYVDDSKESRRIQKWLQEKGVDVLAVKQSTPVGVFPTLDWPNGRLEGTANIELYFDRRRPKLSTV